LDLLCFPSFIVFLVTYIIHIYLSIFGFGSASAVHLKFENPNLVQFVFDSLLAINAIPNVPIPNTQKFWSDRKPRLTDILDPKKDTTKHDCFWEIFNTQSGKKVLSIGYWTIYRNFSMPSQTKILRIGFGYWVLGIECWLYLNFFQYQPRQKEYDCWVLGIGYWVLSVGYWTIYRDFSIPSQPKTPKVQIFFQYPIPKIQGPTGNPALWLLVG
jgi:hypothetical protein